MFMQQIVLLATVFAVICATKEQSTNSGYAQTGEHTIHNQHTIYGQPMRDNLAAETELAKRASTSLSTTSGSSNSESQGQTSQIDVGSGGSGNGVIGYSSTPNSYQQFYSPAFGQFGGALFAATAAPSSASSASGATTPQVFYVRAPAQYVAPSGVGTIKLTYNGESSQPTTTIQYAAAAPKFAYTLSSNPYQMAYATQPNPYSYAPLSLASPYTTSGYASPNIYGNGPISGASLQQGQIIPYTTAANGGLYLSAANLQQFGFSLPQPFSPSATVQPLTAYTTATPIVPSVSKFGANVVTPTASAYYAAAPASQTYQQSPSFLSYANAAASPLNYAPGKFYAVPSYTQAFRSVVAPTISSTTSPYAYVQPTGSYPTKYSLTQPLSNNYAPSSTAYNQKLYAPSSITATTSPYSTSAVHQSLNQAIAAQASNTNGAIQYASQQLYPSGNKYGYSQFAATPQKYFYASS